jgi:hypothetical protein
MNYLNQFNPEIHAQLSKQIWPRIKRVQ